MDRTGIVVRFVVGAKVSVIALSRCIKVGLGGAGRQEGATDVGEIVAHHPMFYQSQLGALD